MNFITASILISIHFVISTLTSAQAIEAQGPPPKVTSEYSNWEGKKRYWQSRDPIADASDAISKQDYRLLFIPVGMGVGTVAGAKCVIRLPDPHVFMRGIISDARSGAEQPKYEKALRSYGARYNHKIISSANYPLSDFCQSTPVSYLSDALEPTSFHTPSGPSDMSLVGAIRRQDLKSIKYFETLNTQPKKQRLFGLSPIEWAALGGDSEIFAHIYNNEIYKLSLANPEREKLLVEIAVIRGNVEIVETLLKDKYEYPAFGGSRRSSMQISSTQSLSAEMFELIHKYIPMKPKDIKQYLLTLKRYNNLDLIFYLADKGHISRGQLFNAAFSTNSAQMRNKYIAMFSLGGLERDFINSGLTVWNDTLLNLLMEHKVDKSALLSKFYKPQKKENRRASEWNNISLQAYKKLYMQYGIAPDDAIKDALYANDTTFLTKTLKLRHNSYKLSPLFKAKLYAASLRKGNTDISQVLTQAGITQKSIANTIPCIFIIGRSKVILPMTDEATKALMRDPKLIMECHTPLLKMNLSTGPTIDWRKIVPYLTKEQALILIGNIVHFTDIKPLDKQYHLDSIAAEFIRKKDASDAIEIIRQVYKALPDAKTLSRLGKVALDASDAAIVNTLFELGLDAKFKTGFEVISADGYSQATVYDAVDTGQISKVKLYLDKGFDHTITSPKKGPFPMYACLKLGIEAKQLFDQDNRECETGLTLRTLQDNISNKDAKAASKTLKLLHGKWEALRGWHQAFLRALIVQKLYGPLKELVSELPSPDSWRSEKLRTSKDRSGGLSDYGFWKRVTLNKASLSSYKGLVSLAFKTDNIDVIAAVLKYYSGLTQPPRSEKISRAAPYVTAKTYSLFIKALKRHDIPMDSHYLKLTVVEGSQDESLRSKDTKQLYRILTIYLNQRRIVDAIELLSQMRERDIELGDIHKRGLSTLAESIGRYDLTKQIEQRS